MEKIKIAKPRASDLGEALGIPEDRQDELAKKLDDMFGGALRVVYMSEFLEETQKFCNTQEEFIWCITNHIQWLAVHGRLIRPKKK